MRERSRVHVVKEGESLALVAIRELDDHSRWREIADLNAIRDPRRLEAGQELVLPPEEG